jgi:hypothetical protein
MLWHGMIGRGGLPRGIQGRWRRQIWTARPCSCVRTGSECVLRATNWSMAGVGLPYGRCPLRGEPRCTPAGVKSIVPMAGLPWFLSGVAAWLSSRPEALQSGTASPVAFRSCLLKGRNSRPEALPFETAPPGRKPHARQQSLGTFRPAMVFVSEGRSPASKLAHRKMPSPERVLS